MPPRSQLVRLALLGAAGLLIGAATAGIAFFLLPKPQTSLEVYYSDPQFMFLVPVSRTLEKTPEGVLSALAQPPKGLVPILPKEATASATLNGNQGFVTLRIPTLGGGSEQLMAAGIVKSLSGLGAQEVKLSLQDPQGKEYPSEHLDTSAPMHATDPEMENTWQWAEGATARVYWSTAGYLVPLRIPLPEAARPIESSFRALLQGPESLECSFLAASVPASLHPSLQGIRDGVAEVKVENPEALPAETWETAQRAMVLTLTEFRSVTGVRFLGTDLPGTPVTRPAWINR